MFPTFCMKTMIPLRLAAIVSNVPFMAYAIGGGLYPILRWRPAPGRRARRRVTPRVEGGAARR